MYKRRKNKKQQASINIVSSIIGIIATIVFVSGFIYILSSLDEFIVNEPADNPLESSYTIYLILRWSIIIIGAIVILICIYRLIKAVVILSSRDNNADYAFNSYYKEEATQKKYKETMTFISREIKYYTDLDMSLGKTHGRHEYYVKGITGSNYIIETNVNEYIYFRWIKGLVADVTFLYKRDADNDQIFNIEEVNILNSHKISGEVINNCLEDEKRRLNEYIQRSEKGIISKLTDNNGYFATSHVNSFKIINSVNTPEGMEIYLSTVGNYLKPVGYPYFKYKTVEFTKYKTGDIVRIDMKKITRLDLYLATPQCWFYDISYLNEDDIKKGSRCVNLVNQYLY
ncbi:MAG: hypothetical protein K2M73_11625 [Lachnospiraceae bacterium]|nr:hypothetical protein [Lachnospiraceae bacterium]